MITPQQYDAWPEPIVELAQELEDYIIRDICRRLQGAGLITSTAYLQTQSLIDYSGLSEQEIRRRIAEITDISEKEIAALYQKTIDQIISDGKYVYEALGIPSSFENREIVQNLLRADALQTQDTFKNITQSLGFMVRENGRLAFKPVAEMYQHTLDFAIQQIQSGGVDPSTAIKQAVIRLTDSGLRTVDYSSGHVDHADVAVRRAVVTGMHQISAKMTEQQMRELGTNLIEVSAHSGARDKGDGFINHKDWQGKVYWYGAPHEKYPSLVAVTGYGDVAGLKGANCRHDIGIFVDGVSRRIWSDKDLQNIDAPDFVFEGKAYTAYEATQRQREIERNIRFYERRFMALRETGVAKDDPLLTNTASLISAWRQKYSEFSKAAGLRTQLERARVYGWGRSEAAQIRALS